MEDEDNENGLVDIWNLWEESYCKEAVINVPTTQITNSSSGLDDKEENRENCFYAAYSRKSNSNRNSYASIKNVIKGLKKSILKQNKKDSLYDKKSSQIVQSNDTGKEKKDEAKVKPEKMSEYTQYLGLQPTTKSECEKCNTPENASCDSKSYVDDCNCSLSMSPHQEVNNLSGSQSPNHLPSVANADLLNSNCEVLNTNSLEITASSGSEIPLTRNNEIYTAASCEIQQTGSSEVSPASSMEILSIDDSEQACTTELPLSSICDFMPVKYSDNATSDNEVAPSPGNVNEPPTDVQLTSSSDLPTNCISQESLTNSEKLLSSNSLSNVLDNTTPASSSKLLNSDGLNQTFPSDSTKELQASDYKQTHARDYAKSPTSSNKIPSSSSFESVVSNTCKGVLVSNHEIPSTSDSKQIDDKIYEGASVNSCERPSTNKDEISASISSDDASINSQEVPSTSSYEQIAGKAYTEVSTSNVKKSEENPMSKQINSKSTRKVYLCAACETYFENWNLFTHMREVHKRYICLFCLGMFGQAERLSHHLAKKHSITEMVFQSVEEFYKSFEGSCYLVCCSCEKMFSETDNFYNHYCPEKSKLEDLDEQSSSNMCTVCRQVGKHLETCSLSLEKSDEANVSSKQINNSKVSSVNTFAPSQTITGVRRHSTRTIKPNRPNDDVYLYTKLTNIRTKRTKQSVSESEKSDCSISDTQNNVCRSKDLELEQNLVQDPIAETIMEVSQCNEGSNGNQSDQCLNNLHQSCNTKDISSTYNSECAKNIYDSVTETIMEVSQCNNEFTGKIELYKNPVIKSSDPKSEDDVRLCKTEYESDETKELVVENNLCNDPNEESNSDSQSQASHSPNSQSLSNPTNEKQKFEFENIEPTKLELKMQSNLSVTPVPDRSLVIKICTKNNSMFSVSAIGTTSRTGDENQDDSRESEENNNSEVSDHKASVTEQSDGNREHFANENESDSDDKPAVVDNSEEETGNNMQETKSDLDITNLDECNKSNLENKLYETNEQTFEADNIEINDGILLAGTEIPLTDINVDDLLENTDIEDLLKLCIQAMCASCVYCNHARLIAINGKQLCLHMLSEHRFQPQHPAIIINCEQFIIKLKSSLEGLESYCFNLNSYNTKQGTYNISTVKVYECFHCRFHSSSHKELYMHNRKMHQKSILICIMCKSTFYSYSELLCHLCPGVYDDNNIVQYRCCFCPLTNLPSAFRLMVHLRKQHHACDVCLETTGSQQRLSNHVWKHKLHHLCYRCGIAYRNKPDITKHLFWKHGTESMLCKKCLQKKWPHVYHFCIPPASFMCEECGSSFSKAIALKVHKRIHSSEFPYSCSECLEKFISKKLLAKHDKLHKEPPPSPQVIESSINNHTVPEEEIRVDVCGTEIKEDVSIKVDSASGPKEIVKKVIDVYDLPPLNLSSDSDSEVENDKQVNDTEDTKLLEIKLEDTPDTSKFNLQDTEIVNSDLIVEVERNEEEKKQEEQIMDGIWDNFKSYTESLEKQESSTTTTREEDTNQENTDTIVETIIDSNTLTDIILAEHDYCVVYSNKNEESQSPNNILTKPDCDVQVQDKIDISSRERTPSPKITPKDTDNPSSSKKKLKSPKKKKQNACTSSSDSSSDSDSSSCSCGTGCSCSSSSSSNSSSSDSSSNSGSSASEGSPKKMNSNREKRKKSKEVKNLIDKEETTHEIVQDVKEVVIMKDQEDVKTNDVESVKMIIPMPIEIVESDLETTESETDEDFYDENPQQHANKLLAEKRNKLLLATAAPDSMDSMEQTPLNNGIIDSESTIYSSAPQPLIQNSPKEPTQKRKVKTRRRKRGARDKARNQSIKLNIPKSVYQKKTGTTPAPRKKSKSYLSPNRSFFNIDQATVSESSMMLSMPHAIGGSGSETDGKRSSKRKRVPKRFYGDSSDEEDHKQKMLKWKRFDIPLVAQSPLEPTNENYQHSFHEQQQLILQQQQQEFLMQQQQQQLLLQQQQQHQLYLQQQQQQQLFMQQQLQIQQEQLLLQQQLPDEEEEEENDAEESALVIAASSSESNEAAQSSSDSNDSEDESKVNERTNVTSQPQILYPALYPANPERTNNLYCYCQCPYDEVSEMIACDGDECQIEWFHFECVGITVPPKGKWYCPDCRRKLGITDNAEELASG